MPPKPKKVLSDYPEIAAQFDIDANGGIAPDQIAAGSSKRLWWFCTVADDHRWQASVSQRTRSGSGCPCCAGRQLARDNSLAALFPDIAAQFDVKANDGRHPREVLAGTADKYWWRCPEGPDHAWETSVSSRTRAGSGCPCCAGMKLSVTNSLATIPSLAAEFAVDLNGMTPEDLVAGSRAKRWWRCRDGHEWLQSPSQRVLKASTCRECVIASDNLAVSHPDLAAELDVKAAGLTPDRLRKGTTKKVPWVCSVDQTHRWSATVVNRTRHGRGCPFCAGKHPTAARNLAVTHPDIAAEFDLVRNAPLRPEDLTPGTARRVWWLCPKGADHRWRTAVAARTNRGSGCPRCSTGWTRAAARSFLLYLADRLASLGPAELHALVSANGLLDSERSGLGRAVASGRLSRDDLLALAEDPDAIDDVVSDDLGVLDEADLVEVEDPAERMPGRDPGEVLAGAPVLLAGVEGIEELAGFVESTRVALLWDAAFDPERRGRVEEVMSVPQEDGFAERIRLRFRDELEAALAVPTPPGWGFRPHPGAPVSQPNLMQRHVADRVAVLRRFGNWSGTGAGKTVSAVLASAHIDAGVTVVVCPNNVVDGWVSTITGCLPDARVVSRTLEPVWADGTGPRWQVVNFDVLSQEGAEDAVGRLAGAVVPGMVVIDEVQFAKRTSGSAESRRRAALEALLVASAEARPDLAVLGMSATPVVNDLHEAKSLMNLICGGGHDDLPDRASVNNAMVVHRRLVTTGIRWKPGKVPVAESRPRVDAGHLVDEVAGLGRDVHPQHVEAVLLPARLGAIVDACQDGPTLVYTEHIDGVVAPMTAALEATGLRVGMFIGETPAEERRANLAAFRDGELDVLIGSRTVGTGVDGLQYATNRLVFATLPWTAAGYDQAVGRLHRHGQDASRVEVVVPVAEIVLPDGSVWSYDELRLRRIRFKRTLADAAVDGVPPEGMLMSDRKATREALRRLRELVEGEAAA